MIKEKNPVDWNLNLRYAKIKAAILRKKKYSKGRGLIRLTNDIFNQAGLKDEYQIRLRG
jgi:hypothetical protein